ncbi:MAG TPA: hypothetical protein VKE70_06135 [Candidatus Solibacter sp.]|nr:hypothetical protein [Candidatus Solibacter sp.]
MNKILVGVVLGLILGLLDGATAWFTPEVRSQMGGILIGSSIKGMLVGVLAGWYARKVQSTAKGVIVGSALGFLFALLVAISQGDHYLEILLPGFVVGAMIGFLTQRMGTPASVTRK